MGITINAFSGVVGLFVMSIAMPATGQEEGEKNFISKMTFVPAKMERGGCNLRCNRPF